MSFVVKLDMLVTHQTWRSGRPPPGAAPQGLPLSKIDHHNETVDELDVEGILAFAARILPRASDVWVQASLDYKQRLPQWFFPEESVSTDGHNRFWI